MTPSGKIEPVIPTTAATSGPPSRRQYLSDRKCLTGFWQKDIWSDFCFRMKYELPASR